jgi:CBS domain-containing protein
MPNVTELMTPMPVKVPASQSIQDCARILWRLGIRHLPVVDEQGRCIGVITDFDLLQHGELVGDDGTWLGRGDQPRAAALARTDPVECREADDLMQVVREMRDRGTDVAVVVDARRHPVGILTEHDVVRWSRLSLPTAAVLPAGEHEIYAVGLHEPALAAFDQMIDHDVRHLVVVDDGRPVGVLSWRDLVVEDVLGFRNVRVSDMLPARELISLPTGASWRDIADEMVRHRVGCIPLLSPDGAVATVITRSDVVGAVLGREPALDELFN